MSMLVMMSLPRWRARRQAKGAGGTDAHRASLAARRGAASRLRFPRRRRVPGRPPPTHGDAVRAPDLSLAAPRQSFSNPRRGAEHLLVTQ